MWCFSSLFCFLHLFIPVPDKQSANMLEGKNKITRQLSRVKHFQTNSQIPHHINENQSCLLIHSNIWYLAL